MKRIETTVPRRKIIRLIVPAYTEYNVYTAFAKQSASLGLMLIASAINKILGWEVEVIDENNCSQRTWPGNAEDGKIDHRELQKYRPADIVGFYASLSSTIPRVFQLAEIYKATGALTVAGGYHARAMAEDMLNHNIDIVAMSEGERTMVEIIQAYDRAIYYSSISKKGQARDFLPFELANVASISYMRESKLFVNPPRAKNSCPNPLPLPDFSLMKFGRIKVYPINWKRGCPYNCEFCAVKERPNFVSAEEFITRIEYLVEKFNAKKFFIVDDHFGGSLDKQDDYAETMKLLKLLQEYQKRIGKRLSFTIQIRLNMSEKSELLSEMKKAGIDHVCIGYESPIDEELKRMCKGYGSTEMIKWTQQWLKAGFFVHGMFIFGYPKRASEIETTKISVAERAKIYRKFIKQAKISTVQVLLTVPLPGTELRKWLEEEGRIFPIEHLGWEYYDGQYVLYQPDNGTPEELQDAMKSIMGKFYHFGNISKLFVNWCFHFPRIVFPAVATLATCRTRYICQAYQTWRKKYHRNTWIKAGGWFVFKKWNKQQEDGAYRNKLNEAKKALDTKTTEENG